MEQSGRWVDPQQHGRIYLTDLRVYNYPLLRPVMCVPHHSKKNNPAQGTRVLKAAENQGGHPGLPSGVLK